MLDSPLPPACCSLYHCGVKAVCIAVAIARTGGRGGYDGGRAKVNMWVFHRAELTDECRKEV